MRDLNKEGEIGIGFLNFGTEKWESGYFKIFRKPAGEEEGGPGQFGDFCDQRESLGIR